MKQNKLTIKINKPAREVFDFTINPKNTHKWIKSIEIEKSSDWPIKISTKYKNKGKDNNWSEYKVTDLKQNKVFELVSSDSNYHVRYTYKPIDQNSSEMEYLEWVDKGELDNPFVQSTMEKLKELVEEKK